MIDEHCVHLVTQKDRNGSVAIWYCPLLEDQGFDFEGNCGSRECTRLLEKQGIVVTVNKDGITRI